MAEKFRKEIRWVYNQRMPWLQIMTEAGLQKVGRLGRDGASGLANNLPSKLARRGQVHNLRANNKWTESILREWMCYLPVSLRCWWAERDFLVFCSNSLDPPEPERCRFFAFRGHAKLLSNELPATRALSLSFLLIVGWSVELDRLSVK